MNFNPAEKLLKKLKNYRVINEENYKVVKKLCKMVIYRIAEAGF